MLAVACEVAHCGVASSILEVGQAKFVAQKGTTAPCTCGQIRVYGHDHPVGSSSQDCPSADDSTVAASSRAAALRQVPAGPWVPAGAAALRQAPKGPWAPEGQGRPGISM